MSFFTKIRDFFKKSDNLYSFILKIKFKFEWWFLSDVQYVKINFKQRLNRKVNLKNPTMYNDKLQWLKLYWYDPIVSKCADKYLARGIVKETVGDKYLNELYGVYNSVDEIDFNKLPNSFVMRCNHGCGYNVICKDKSNLDWDKESKKLKKWLKIDYYRITREWIYKDIKPCIICEKYLEEADGEKLINYKVMCYYGKPEFIISAWRKDGALKRYIFDSKWELLNDELKVPIAYDCLPKKPEKFDEMIKVCKKLSKGFPHIRIDLYYPNNEIYFGEFTFLAGNGLFRYATEEFEIKFGEVFVLPNKKIEMKK